MDRLRFEELTVQGGVNLETIRHYERKGLLPPLTSSGY